MYIPGISGGVHDEMAKSARGQLPGQAESHGGHSAGGVVSWRKLVDIAYCVTARQGPRAPVPPLGVLAQGGGYFEQCCKHNRLKGAERKNKME
jgi:hypothetical protein